MYKRLPLILALLSCSGGLCYWSSGSGDRSDQIMEDSNEIGRKPTTNFQNPLTSSASSGLYLNIDYPALRNGNLTSWSFCYYIKRIGDSKPNITVGIWRQTANNSFQAVPGSVEKLPIEITDARFEFICQNFHSINKVSIERGDIVGAYLPAGPSNVHVISLSDEDGDMSILYSNESSIHAPVDCDLLSRSSYGLYAVAYTDVTDSEDVTDVNNTADPTSMAVTHLPVWIYYALGALSVVIIALGFIIMVIWTKSCCDSSKRKKKLDYSLPQLTSIVHNNEAAMGGPQTIKEDANGLGPSMTHHTEATIILNTASFDVANSTHSGSGSTGSPPQIPGNFAEIDTPTVKYSEKKVSIASKPNEKKRLKTLAPLQLDGATNRKPVDAAEPMQHINGANKTALHTSFVQTNSKGKTAPNISQSSLQRTNSTPELHTLLPSPQKELLRYSFTASNDSLYAQPSPPIKSGKVDAQPYLQPRTSFNAEKVEPQPYLEFQPTYSYAYGKVGSRLQNYRGKKRYENWEINSQQPRPQDLDQTRIRSTTCPIETPDYAEIPERHDRVFTSLPANTHSTQQSIEDRCTSKDHDGVATMKPKLKPKPVISKELLKPRRSSPVIRRPPSVIQEEETLQQKMKTSVDQNGTTAHKKTRMKPQLQHVSRANESDSSSVSSARLKTRWFTPSSFGVVFFLPIYLCL